MRMDVNARALRVEGAALPQWQGQPALLPVRLEGREGVNRLFEYRLLLKTPDSRSFSPFLAANFKLNEFVGRELTVHIELEGSGTYVVGAVGSETGSLGAGTREITGLVDSARFVKIAGRHAFYEFVLRPWLHLATRTSDCKIFHNKTVVEILDEVLADYSFPAEKRFGTQYPERETQTQLNETDADFLMRLCQEWGINFHFEHSEGKHRLVLSDNNGAFVESPSEAYRELRFHDGRNQIDEEFVTEFTVTDTLTSGSYESRDFDYTRPRALLAARVRSPRDTGQSGQDIFRWRADDGSDYSQPNAGRLADANQTESQGELLAHLRMEAMRQHGLRAQGAGELRGLLPGHTFRLKGHPQELANGDYVAIDTELLIEDVAAVSQMTSSAAPTAQGAQGDGAAAQQWRVQLRFEAQPARQPLRPEFSIPKPRQHSPETALVVGASDSQGVPNNIYTDEFGRVKIQFHWDRYGEKDHRSSCWVRVSSEWAGNQAGAMHLPRVGQEVIVSFLGGDPDLPMVTGRVFNQHNLPPWELPGQQALSGFRSRELKPGGGNSAAGRSNHLIFDDTSGSIQAQLKSDHQHSQLSLGDISRIENNAGRQEPRGEGFELRSDGHGAVRAKAGMLLTTEARERARNHTTDMGETVHRLERAHDHHETLAALARHHHAQEDNTDQAEVAGQLNAQNQTIKGTAGADSASTGFPELAAPHLVLASAAGIGATAAGTLQLAAGQHIAATSAGHTSLSSAKSLLGSAMDAIRLFAQNLGIRIVAAKGPVQVQAQDDNIELIAQKGVEVTSTTDWTRIKAEKGISLEVEGTRFEITRKGVQIWTTGVSHVWAGDHQTFGPKSAAPLLPELPRSVCIPCMLKAAKAGSAITRF
ncbi:type VI secretion system Vgr family protein [Variovorax ginsengisoli]|uniref:Type VI secretion system secreted protein VgrG n=1 Tax=Variovorax ginsengisoli TaxID=363844 RepID=A0ABT9SFE6_9BURK|nr:type VI secretion system Vgr family protein [Variovorax ginsengisoli]MDP9902506.1 type VI secretion system secreted protein VgrG [Variovorax ginsengisoli]